MWETLQNPSKIFENPSQIDQKRSQIEKNASLERFRRQIATRSAPGGGPDPRRQLGDSTFGAFLAENVAPRVDLSCLRQYSRSGPREVGVLAVSVRATMCK